MKKKQVRVIAIAAIVLVVLGLGLAALKIEPADGGAPHTQETATSSVEKNATKKPVKPARVSESSDKTEDMPTETPEESTTPETSPAPKESATPETTATPKKPATPETTPAPKETAVPEIHTCTLEIRCDTVVDTSKLENEAVIPYIPSSGVILATTEVTFTPGENVFEVLNRATRERGIQMEFREDALYSGAYIEGINYLYEFDGGTLSGWMYKVNGQFPNYGCSQYTVEDGDAIVWMYTCDLGRDVGDNSVW